MGNDLAKVENNQEDIARIAEKYAVDLPALEDDLLEERYGGIKDLAVAFGTSVANMRRCLADPAISEKFWDVQRKAGIAELNIVEIKMLNEIVNGQVASPVKCPHCFKMFESNTAPTPRIRAAKRLREIYDPKKGGSAVNVNVQQNNITQTKGDFEQSVYEVANKRDASD